MDEILDLIDSTLVDTLSDDAMRWTPEPIDLEGHADYCDGDHDDSFCCNCGHFHSGDCPDSGPCGDYRCCIN